MAVTIQDGRYVIDTDPDKLPLPLARVTLIAVINRFPAGKILARLKEARQPVVIYQDAEYDTASAGPLTEELVANRISEIFGLPE